MGGKAAAPDAPAKKSAPAPVEKPAPAAPATAAGTPVDYGDVAPPPQTDPLGITGDQIEDLNASLAPVGSELLDSYEAPEEPQFDLSEFDVAPVGADLGSGSKEPDPPPPDTSGLSLKD
jgi:hypothetical protein